MATGKQIAVALSALAFGALALTQCEAPQAVHEVQYGVGGSARSASITISNEDGGTEQMEVALPWHRALQMKDGDFAYVSAQNEDRSGGYITCGIVVDREPWKRGQSSGEHSIVSCNGAVGRD